MHFSNCPELWKSEPPKHIEHRMFDVQGRPPTSSSLEKDDLILSSKIFAPPDRSGVCVHVWKATARMMVTEGLDLVCDIQRRANTGNCFRQTLLTKNTFLQTHHLFVFSFASSPALPTDSRCLLDDRNHFKNPNP